MIDDDIYSPNIIKDMILRNIDLPRRLQSNNNNNNKPRTLVGDGSSYNNAARRPNNHLTFSFDHCFAVKGAGTIFTGTLINGSIISLYWCWSNNVIRYGKSWARGEYNGFIKW